MKRQATSASVVFRVLCPNARAGSVLGKGGEVIARLRSETDARIKVEDRVNGCDERVVTISSSESNGEESAEHCPAQLALFKVIERIVDLEAETQACARLLVPKSQARQLLGKAGNKIAAIREDTGAVIRVLNREQDVPLCAVAGEEVVQISGDWNKMEHALQLVSASLRANPPRDWGGQPERAPSGALGLALGGPGLPSGGMAPAGPGGIPLGGDCMDSVFRILIPVVRAGAIIGRHGDQINALRRETGASIKVHEVQAGVDERVVEVKSTDDVASAYCAAQEALLRVGAALLSEGDVHTLRVLVPAAQVGGLVGKGGIRIKSIRQETGTDVRVTSGNAGGVIGGQGAAEVVEMNGSPVPCLHALKTVSSVLRICQAREQRKKVLPTANAASGLFNPLGLAAAAAAFGPNAALLGHHHPPPPPHHHHPAVSLAGALQHHGGGGGPLMLSFGQGGLSPVRSRALGDMLGEDMGGMGAGAPLSLGGLPTLRGAYGGGAPVAGSTSSLRITITKDQVGAVLGHGGSNIQRIRAVSGAKVKLHDAEGGREGREVELSGSFEQLQTAHTLLHACLAAAGQN